MPDRPNILFLFSDQQRFDTVNCYEDETYPSIFPNLTPNLDKLADDGVMFRHTFTMQPVCGPARSCLQSGRYCTETGCVTNNRPLPTDIPTMAKQMVSAGYETAYVGKWHLASGGPDDKKGEQRKFIREGVPREMRGGYEDWMASDVFEFTSHGYEGYMFDTDNNRVDFDTYRVDATANFVIDYLRRYHSKRAEKPFFMFASFIEPHHQNDLDRYVGPMGSKQRFADYRTPGDLVGTEPREGAKCDWPLHMPDYLGCCWSLDQNVGRIRAELEQLGLADNTIIIYTSDHGCHFCTRNSEYKRSCHEASIRVPLIVQGPGFEGGQTIDELVSLIDLPTTVLTAGGADVPDVFRGRPLQKLADGKANDWGDDVFVQISEAELGRAVRTRRWKYAITAPEPDDWINGHQGSKRYVESYLYDLEADPHERNNLVDDPSLSDVRDEMRQRVVKHMIEVGEVEPEIAPAS